MAVENLHIKKIRVENYKSLRNSTIELKEGLNIIIGKNGAGKSNMLDFIYQYVNQSPMRFFSSNLRLNLNFLVSYEYEENKVTNIFSYSAEKIKSTSANNPLHVYELVFNKIEGSKKTITDQKISIDKATGKKAIRQTNKDIFKELGAIETIQKIFIPFAIPGELSWISKPCRLVIDEDNSSSIFIDDTYSDSSFFFNIEVQLEFIFFESILHRDDLSAELVKEKLISYLSEYLDQTKINATLNNFTIIKNIRINPNINIYLSKSKIIIENLYVDFFIDNDWLPWSYLSDGTKRIFYLISECISNDSGILLIEEPELGIHPHQLYKILDFLKEQAEEKQIIISTHSPLALDVLNEKELDSIIIAEYENGTKFRHLSKAEISKAKKYMKEVGDLSTYWLHSDLEK